jgi:CubicO group peptidase (beta-lactamase class C family)
VQEGHYPGVAVAVASGKHNLWTKGYGYANLGQKTQIDPQEHLFRIGSISKSVTAAALAREYEKGEILLDIPISTYYTECPADKSNLTLRQVAGHLAGIRHYNGDEFLSNIHYRNVTDPLDVFIHDTLLCKPGEQFHYSTYGWTLVSVVMERAMHEPFTDIVDKEVIQPLHLTDIKPDQKDSVSYHRVLFYQFQDSAFEISPEVDVSNK